MNTFEVMRIDPAFIRRCVDFSVYILKVLEDLASQGTPKSVDHRRAAVKERSRLALISSLVGREAWPEYGLDKLQFEIPVGSALAVDYFCGPWRDAYQPWDDDETTIWDRKTCRAEFQWVDPYRDGLICAFYIDDRAAVMKILSYTAGGALGEDEGTLDRTADDCAFYELLGAYGVGDTSLMQRQLDVVRNSKRRRVKLLTAMFESMLGGDAKIFAKATNKYLAGYMKTEHRTNRLDAAISLDGTIMWHLAKLAGCADMGLVEDELRPLLLALPPV